MGAVQGGVVIFQGFDKNKSTDTETSEKAETSQVLSANTNTLWHLFAQMSKSNTNFFAMK